MPKKKKKQKKGTKKKATKKSKAKKRKKKVIPRVGKYKLVDVAATAADAVDALGFDVGTDEQVSEAIRAVEADPTIDVRKVHHLATGEKVSPATDTTAGELVKAVTNTLLKRHPRKW